MRAGRLRPPGRAVPRDTWIPAFAGMTALKAREQPKRAGRPRSQDTPLPEIRHQGAGSRAADDSSSFCRRLHG